MSVTVYCLHRLSTITTTLVLVTVTIKFSDISTHLLCQQPEKDKYSYAGE